MTKYGFNVSCSVLFSAICLLLFIGCTTNTKVLFQDGFELGMVTKKPQKPWVSGLLMTLAFTLSIFFILKELYFLTKMAT